MNSVVTVNDGLLNLLRFPFHASTSTSGRVTLSASVLLNSMRDIFKDIGYSGECSVVMTLQERHLEFLCCFIHYSKNVSSSSESVV